MYYNYRDFHIRITPDSVGFYRSNNFSGMISKGSLLELYDFFLDIIESQIPGDTVGINTADYPDIYIMLGNMVLDLSGEYEFTLFFHTEWTTTTEIWDKSKLMDILNKFKKRIEDLP